MIYYILELESGEKVKKILIRIENKTLFFSYKHQKLLREDLMNTNIISDSELIFSDDYILNNIKIVIPFFKELCETNNIKSLTFQDKLIASNIIPLFRDIKSIKAIKIKKEETISYEICEQIIALKHIELLDCYSIANFMLELLDKHHIKVSTHSEVFYISKFMLSNNLTDYSKMFYKKEINIYEPLSNEDKADFLTFLQINKYLKIINVNVYERETILYLCEQLNKQRFKNVVIELWIDLTDNDEITYLRELNKRFKPRNIKIILQYSNEYISKNLLKQISLNTLKLCGLLLLSLVIGSLSYVFIRNYKAMQEVSSIKSVVEQTIKKAQEEDTTSNEEETPKGQAINNKYISALLTINPDVVGYLKVNNTNVDYPVVLGKDNLYYLKRNLYQEEDLNGWIYMDFRNSVSDLNDNTIIYGHNMYYSGVMFGTLHRVLNSSWYNNQENLTITFDTLYKNMQWQIFSIYTIPKTSDYLRVTFDDAIQKNAYINMVKNRSIKDFEIDVNENDKILTLSTCTDDSKERIIIEASADQ